MPEKSKMKIKKAKKMENLKTQMLANGFYDENNFDMAVKKTWDFDVRDVENNLLEPDKLLILSFLHRLWFFLNFRFL